jgi:hypothetical protein
MIGSILSWIGSFLSNLFSAALSFLANLFGMLFSGLITVLKAIFKPILILVALIFYFVYKLGELILTLFVVLLAIGKLLYSLVMGLFNTLAGLTWTPSTPSHGTWSVMIGEVFTALEPYQLDKIAYLLMFVIWISTAFAAIKILTRGGAGE